MFNNTVNFAGVHSIGEYRGRNDPTCYVRTYDLILRPEGKISLGEMSAFVEKGYNVNKIN